MALFYMSFLYLFHCEAGDFIAMLNRAFKGQLAVFMAGPEKGAEADNIAGRKTILALDLLSFPRLTWVNSGFHLHFIIVEDAERAFPDKTVFIGTVKSGRF